MNKNILDETTIFNQFFNDGNILTFIPWILVNREQLSENNNIIRCPGFLDKYKEISTFLTIFNNAEIKDKLLKKFTDQEVPIIKATIDTLFLAFLQSIKKSIEYFTIYDNRIQIVLGRKSALSSLDKNAYQESRGSIKDLYNDAVTYLNDQIESRSKKEFDSGLVFDAISCFGDKNTQCSIVNAWFKDVYLLLNFYITVKFL